METLSNPILLILGGILLAAMINLFLVTFAKGKSKQSDGNVVAKMLKAAQAPYKETNESLEELARLIEDGKLKKTHIEPTPANEIPTGEDRKNYA
jgi:hypothetical protein